MQAVQQEWYNSDRVIGQTTRECLLRQVEDAIPHLRRYARSLTSTVDEADDIVQEALVRAITKLDLFEPGSNLRAWLFTIARNTFISQIRQRRHLVPLDEDAPGPTTLPRQESGVALSEMARAYGRLAPPQREVLALVVFEGMSYEQVGEVIGVPIGTVRSRLSRARSALREMFPDDRH